MTGGKAKSVERLDSDRKESETQDKYLNLPADSHRNFDA